MMFYLKGLDCNTVGGKKKKFLCGYFKPHCLWQFVMVTQETNIITFQRMEYTVLI